VGAALFSDLDFPLHNLLRTPPFLRPVCFFYRFTIEDWRLCRLRFLTIILSFSRAFRSLTRALPSRLPVGTANPLAITDMSWLHRLNPTPGFPPHTGPYKVGSVDVEIPTSDLDSPSVDAPPADLPTVAFRIFYPCKQDSNEKAVRWIPSPQREYISAYARFLGANSAFASVFS